MNFTFTKATKKRARLRMAVVGPPGSGKTVSLLKIARAMIGPAGRIAVIDTETGSASKYSWDPDLYPADTPIPPLRFVFDVLELSDFSPSNYVKAIEAADALAYDVIIVDSLSHAWNSKGGALEMVDNIARKSKTHSTFNAWRDVTPEQNKMVEAILRSRAHVLVSMRVKTEYVIETDARTGKSSPRKIGLAPVQRGDLEYEFDVFGQLDENNGLSITKTRCSALTGVYIDKPGEEIAATLRQWLEDGADEPEPMRTHIPPSAAAPATAGITDATRARMDNPKIKALFDQLKAPISKRIAALEKYKSDSKLIEVLEGKVREAMSSAVVTAMESLQPALPPPSSEAPSSKEAQPSKEAQ